MGETTEILYGYHCVAEALSAGRRRIHRIRMSASRRDRRIDRIGVLAGQSGVPVETVPPDRITQMARTPRHQGVAAETGPFPLTDVRVFTDKEAAPDGRPVLILDSLTDAGNLGAILRTALCAGVAGVILPNDRSVSPSPAVSRASAGAMEHMHISCVPNLVAVIDRMKSGGRWVYGLDAQGDTTLFDGDLAAAAVIVVGGEDKGIRPLVRRHCDVLLTIPQTSRINSLNASVAAGVVLYECLRQRMVAGGDAK